MATLKVGQAPENGPSQEAQEDWYADQEGNLTNDPADAAFHVAEKGQPIQPLMIRKYGFVDGRPKETDAAKRKEAADADKAEEEDDDAAAERAERAAQKKRDAEEAASKGAKPAENKRRL